MKAELLRKIDAARADSPKSPGCCCPAAGERRSVERTRLFGSPLSVGVVDIVLAQEALRPGAVRERWLEYRLEGEFSLGGDDSRRVPLRGVADRIDLLEGNRLRVIDYKTGSAPERSRALQVPVYALCAQERLCATALPAVEEGLYLSFAGKRSVVRMVEAGDPEMLEAPRAGARPRRSDQRELPPRPHDPMICSYCAYASVCRG